MNTEILKRLSVKQLHELKQAVESEISSRLDMRIYPGRVGYFVISDNGKKQRVIVERLNSKSITVKALDDSRKGWRIPPSMLVLDDKPLDDADRPRTLSASPSETYNVAAW